MGYETMSTLYKGRHKKNHEVKLSIVKVFLNTTNSIQNNKDQIWYKN